MNVVIVDVQTGKTQTRPRTAEEQAQADTDLIASAARVQAEVDDRAARDKAEGDWRAAVAKATTVDEIKAALLGTGLSVQADVRRKP